MNFDNWDKDEAGRVRVWPLKGFTTAVFDAKVGAVRLEVGAPRPGAASAAFQVSMPADLMRALAQALTETADRIERRAAAGPMPKARN